MNERILKWLFDIKDAIQEIEGYFIEYPKNLDAYKSNILIKRAIERDLEIIGEAINRILKADSEFPLVHARRIIGLRNQIIHSYDNISDEIIWAVISKHIPLLKEEVNRLIMEAKWLSNIKMTSSSLLACCSCW